MRFFSSLVPSLLLLGAGVAQAASGWGFEDAVVSVASKGAGVGGGSKDKYVILQNDEFLYHAYNFRSNLKSLWNLGTAC